MYKMAWWCWVASPGIDFAVKNGVEGHHHKGNSKPCWLLCLALFPHFSWSTLLATNYSSFHPVHVLTFALLEGWCMHRLVVDCGTEKSVDGFPYGNKDSCRIVYKIQWALNKCFSSPCSFCNFVIFPFSHLLMRFPGGSTCFYISKMLFLLL